MSTKKNFSYEVVDKMKVFNEHFKHYSIKHFNHDITFGCNKIAILSSDEKVLSYYLKNDIPAICTNEDGRVLNNGIYFDKVLMKHHTDCAHLLPNLYHQFDFKNTIHIVEREQECQHLYTFAFNMCESEFLHFVINNINSLTEFICYYNKIAGDIIKEAKKPKNHLVLPPSINIASDKNRSHVTLILLKKITKN